jgi:hypothetical protein
MAGTLIFTDKEGRRKDELVHFWLVLYVNCDAMPKDYE